MLIPIYFVKLILTFAYHSNFEFATLLPTFPPSKGPCCLIQVKILKIIQFCCEITCAEPEFIFIDHNEFKLKYKFKKKVLKHEKEEKNYDPLMSHL